MLSAPELPKGLTFSRFSLTVSGSVQLPESRLDWARGVVNSTEGDDHCAFYAPFPTEKQKAELWILLGVHTTHYETAPDPETFEFHYEVRLQRHTGRGEGLAAGRASAIFDELRTLPEHSVRVLMTVWAPTEALQTPVSLPFPISQAAVPGFSEVRGVRLVKIDPEDPELELYSAIVDTYGPNSSIQITAPMTAVWSSNLLIEAASLGFSVVELAIGPVLSEADNGQNR
jgi:hypothetical protein